MDEQINSPGVTFDGRAVANLTRLLEDAAARCREGDAATAYARISSALAIVDEETYVPRSRRGTGPVGVER